VLTLGKLGHGQEAYCLDSVASGIEDYYSGDCRAPGGWTGSGCEELGLSGEV
jgi:TrwC relaxase